MEEIKEIFDRCRRECANVAPYIAPHEWLWAGAPDRRPLYCADDLLSHVVVSFAVGPRLVGPANG